MHYHLTTLSISLEKIWSLMPEELLQLLCISYCKSKIKKKAELDRLIKYLAKLEKIYSKDCKLLLTFYLPVVQICNC